MNCLIFKHVQGKRLLKTSQLLSQVSISFKTTGICTFCFTYDLKEKMKNIVANSFCIGKSNSFHKHENLPKETFTNTYYWETCKQFFYRKDW